MKAIEIGVLGVVGWLWDHLGLRFLLSTQLFLANGSHSQGLKMCSGATAICPSCRLEEGKIGHVLYLERGFPELPGHTFTHISLARTSHMATWPDLPCQQCGLPRQNQPPQATTLLSFFPLLPSLPYRFLSFSSISHMY